MTAVGIVSIILVVLFLAIVTTVVCLAVRRW